MEANITQPQHSSSLLSEPHFDDEATLLSARPVVPLHEVKAAERSRRRLTFGLTLVAAIVVGAFGATLIYRQRGQSPAAATVDTAAPNAEVLPSHRNAPAAGGGTTEASPPASSASANLNDVPKPEPGDIEAAAATRSRKPTISIAQIKGVAHKTAQNTSGVKSTETSRDEADRVENERAQRRAERLETRRQRREARREAGGEVRSRRVRQGDDLLRIREIFEGPRRPPRLQRWQ